MIRTVATAVFLLVLGGASRAETIAQLKADVQALEQSLKDHQSQTPYMAIDTVHNRLVIRQAKRVLLEAACATGSAKVLLKPEDQDRWQFHTPKGLRRVQRKVTDPVWAKPVWAFVESGETAPVLPWEFRRLDPTTLGDYALELGDGYEVHGTLYPALLGRNITHGCIRLNDDDLSAAYRTMRVGSRVYIY